MSRTPRHWIAVIAASATLAAVPAIAPPLTPRDVRVVDDVDVALAASWSPEQQAVIDDFHRGGLAEVLRVQGTARLTHPDQVQIINDFFEGGVVQTEGRRWIALFNDPQQQAFLRDLLTGGVVQIVRNRLLDSTADPSTRAAIVAFFPDEVTDYRGGPITMIQRRLIAAAKGNPFVIGLVNAVFDNPVLLAVRRLIGGGPIIGTPLYDLPPLQPPPAAATPDEPAPATSVAATTEPAPSPVDRKTPKPVVAQIDSSPSPLFDGPADQPEVEQVVSATSDASAVTTPANPGPETETRTETTTEPETKPDVTDVVKTGNKVAPTTLAGAGRPEMNGGPLAVFGQVAAAVVAGVAGVAGLAGAPAPANPPSAAADTARTSAGGTDSAGSASTVD